MSDEFTDLGTDVLEGDGLSAEPDGTAATSQGGNPAADEVFYDAKKLAELDPRLVPSYKDMQGSYTKKTQALADQAREYEAYKQFEQTYGGRDALTQAQGLLDLIRDPSGKGNVELFALVGEALGLTRQQLAGLWGEGQQTPGAQAPSQPNPNDPNRPMTVAEFQQLQVQWQQDATNAQEDQQVEGLLGQYSKQVDLSSKAEGNPARDFVLLAAERLPAHLGYAERIKRGVEAYQSHLDAYAAKVGQRTLDANSTAPRPLGGAMPGSSGPTAPRDFAEARQRAEARLNNLDGGFFS